MTMGAAASLRDPSAPIKREPGGSDLLRRLDGKWVRFQPTLTRWASRLRAQANAPGGVGSAQKIDGAAFLAVPIRRAATAAHSDAPVEVFFEAGVSVKLAGEAAARVLETVMARLSSAR